MDQNNLFACSWVLLSLVGLLMIVTFGIMVNVFLYEPLGKTRTFKCNINNLLSKITMLDPFRLSRYLHWRTDSHRQYSKLPKIW